MPKQTSFNPLKADPDPQTSESDDAAFLKSFIEQRYAAKSFPLPSQEAFDKLILEKRTSQSHGH